MTSYDRKSYLNNTSFKKFYLDVANFPSTANMTGNYIVVPPECNNRIDLFSYQQYGSSRLWWVIALANADIVKDPIWDFISGLTLLVPDRGILATQYPELKGN
jgi:hypothetical protein